MNYDRIVFFDTETVGINPNYIISLAYRYYERGKTPIIGEIKCNPDYFISEEASKVNGFTNEQVQEWPLFSELWPTIKDYFDGSLHIGHNIKFDEKALSLEFNRYHIAIPHHYELDTLKIAKGIIPKTNIINYKLGTLCDYLNIKSEDERYHSADFDIWATDKVFRKLRQLNQKSDGLYNSYFHPIEIKGSSSIEDLWS